MTIFFIVAGLVVLAALTLAGVWWKMRRRGLSPQSAAKVQRAWAAVTALPDPVRRVLEADKVLDLALSELGFRGSVADKLKKAGPRLSDANAVWRAHKLRNHLAHEPGAHVSERDAQDAIRAFERAIGDMR